MALHARGFQTRGPEERAVSLLSLFSGQGYAAAGARRIRGINGLLGFPEKLSERNPVRRLVSQSPVRRVASGP